MPRGGMNPDAHGGPREGRLRLGMAVACLAAAGASAGFALAPEPTAQAASSVAVRVAGVQVAQDGAPRMEAVRAAGAYLDQAMELRWEGHRIVRSRRALGVRVDVDRLEALLTGAGDPRSALRRLHERAQGSEPLRLPVPIALDPRPATELLLALKDEVDRPAVPARMDTTRKRFVDGQGGLHLHVAKTLDRLARAAREGERVVPIHVATSGTRRPAEALRAASMDAALATFETRYNASRDAADRTHNLRVAAAKLDGHILLPGEELDFNAVVGDRSEANGFRPAPQIEGGELVDGVGGGACQVAGTLHAAAFFAGLPILERHPHSRPSWYIKLGLDAAVSYPKLNLRFRNDLPHPVVIQMSIEDGVARASLWGPERVRTVTFEREVVSFGPFEEREQEDADLPEDVRVLAQRGVPSFEILSRRIVEDASGDAREEEATVRYPATTQVWRVGTGEAAPEDHEPPPGDRHPEYVADERLVMTQGPGIDGTRERRRAGRTGTYGWMVREGLVAPADPEAGQVLDSAP
jgi:vancomycin resistance protein YoaR